jgi:hypothetical protein
LSYFSGSIIAEQIDEVSNIDQVLQRVSNIVDQRSEQDKDTEISSTMAAIGEDAFAGLLTML